MMNDEIWKPVVGFEGYYEVSNKGKYVGENSPLFGRHHTEEAKVKNRDAHIGKIPWMKGKHHTEEAKQKLREKQLAFQKRKREKEDEQNDNVL